LTGKRGVAPSGPVSDGFRNRHSASIGSDDYDVTALADPWVSERFGDDLWSNPAGIPDGHG
jgi:hypothetical protein